MVHWIYILRCSGDYYYVGKTTRLLSRMWQHESGLGGLNTSIYPPEEIVAIYNGIKLHKFLEINSYICDKIYPIFFNTISDLLDEFNDIYDKDDDVDYHYIENTIAEALILRNIDNREKIRGGKFVRFDCEYKIPINNYIKNLPFCKCNLPCDIRLNEEHKYLFFRCAKKNFFNKFSDLFDTDEPCNFFMKFDELLDYKKEFENKKNEILTLIRESPWLINLVGRFDEFCIGGCGKTYDHNNTVRYSRKAINLCFDCLKNKNHELSEKYSQNILRKGVCFI
jgi:hypothetical protein